MPLCTVCTSPIEHTYTVYSKHNVRLEQCTSCRNFADPYVEHDWLLITLDLILLKPAVYRHLLFNRASAPRYASEKAKEAAGSDVVPSKWTRWWTVISLGLAFVTLDAYIRWSSQYPASLSDDGFWSQHAATIPLKLWVGCLLEIIAFDSGVTFACLGVKSILARTESWSRSTTRDQLHASHVPLSVIYSSFTKLFLLLLLSIWRSSTPSSPEVDHAIIPALLPDWIVEHQWVRMLLEVFDEDKLDREWVVRNLIGGMAAGFGLRVVLDCPPVITTLVVIFGWTIKILVAWFISPWVGTAAGAGKNWIAYSVP